MTSPTRSDPDARMKRILLSIPMVAAIVAVSFVYGGKWVAAIVLLIYAVVTIFREQRRVSGWLESNGGGK